MINIQYFFQSRLIHSFVSQYPLGMQNKVLKTLLKMGIQTAINHHINTDLASLTTLKKQYVQKSTPTPNVSQRQPQMMSEIEKLKTEIDKMQHSISHN